MPSTVQSIAAKVGVSRRVVYQVLNGGRSTVGVGAATRERVLAAAAATGYMPNASARAVSTGRFNSVALLLSTEIGRSFLPDRRHDGIQAALCELDWHLVVSALPDETLMTGGYLPRVLRTWACDGLLVNYNAHLPAGLEDAIREHGIPSVWINSRHTADCIYPDDLGAAREATERLIALGHRRIGWVNLGTGTTETAQHYSFDDRWNGYADAMRAAGLAPLRLSGEKELRHGAELRFLSEQLRRRDRPTALICYNNQDAACALYAAAVVGLQVPGDLSVMAFESRMNDDMGLPVGAMVLPEFEIGREAVAMIRRKIEAPNVALPPKALPCRFEAGATVGPWGETKNGKRKTARRRKSMQRTEK